MPIPIDPCTRLILDFIAGGPPTNPVGESKGNYNAYFGHADSTRDLSRMFLTEIYAFQDAIYRANKISTAIGRYQFLKGTLQDLAKQKNLPPSTPFTPELQDELAVELLVKRGYANWWKGEISDELFANCLSMEWASLPSPGKGGRSYYDGLAGNAASTTLTAVFTMLAEARRLISQPITPPQPIECDLTNEEQEILDILGDAYSKLIVLPVAYINEKADIITAIDAIQNIIAARPIRRKYTTKLKEAPDAKSDS